MGKKINHGEPSRRRRTPLVEPDLVAAQALVYVAADPARLTRFLALTGIDPSAIRSAAAQPGFSVAMLGYLAGDEALLVDFARHHDLDPEAIGLLAQRASGRPPVDP